MVYSNFPNFRFWLRFIEFVRTYPAAADLGTLTEKSNAYALRELCEMTSTDGGGGDLAKVDIG